MSDQHGKGRGRGRGRGHQGQKKHQQGGGSSSAPGGSSGSSSSGPPPGSYQAAPPPVTSAWGRGAQRFVQGGPPSPTVSGPPSAAPSWPHTSRPGPSSAAPSGAPAAHAGPSAGPSGASGARSGVPAAAFDQSTEETSGVGRGGVRGRRRINEGECLLVTRPPQYATKQGTYGRLVDLQANYFKLIAKKDWCLYQYRVDFAPDEERTIVRKGLLRVHHATIGSYIFDGTVMYTSSRLQEGLELFSLRQSDGETIRIKIRMVGELQKGDYHYIQFFNIVMRKCLTYLNMQLVGRNFYDPGSRIVIDCEIPMQLWPGYVTSIRQCENSILMCAEVSHKVLQERTVLHVLQDLYRQNPNDYQNLCDRELLSQIVMTHYNNKTYRIDDIDFKVSPNSTFTLKKNESISYLQYYKNKYNITIRDQNQPLIVSKSKAKDRRAGQAEIIYLIPELCQMTGMSDDIRSNYRVMSALAQHTKLDPDTRIERLLAFNRRLLTNQNVTTELGRWGLQLDNNLIRLSGRVIPRDNIYVQKEALKLRGGNWDNELRSKAMLVVANLKDWVVIIPHKNAQDVQALIKAIRATATGMHFNVAEPKVVVIKNDRTMGFLNALEDVMSQSNPQLVMCVVPNNNMDRYSSIKKKCCVDRPVISQVVLAKTIYAKGRPNLTAATKIAIQMNTKLGGAPWTVDIPEGNIMVAGFDVCHEKGAKGRDYGAFVASLDKKFTRYFSSVSAHKNGEELSNDLSISMLKAVQKYRELNGQFPTTIVFYRDGVGEGQVPFVFEIEVQNLKEKLEQLYDNPLQVRLIFVIVTKKISTRFFDGKYNVPAGTVVDNVVTNPTRFDFFLVSQSGGKGTITPSGYNVIYDTSNWGPDKIQRLTYKLTQMYYNFSGPVKVPAPCQYAHKLAALVGQAIQKPPSAQLETLLYFL